MQSFRYEYLIIRLLYKHLVYLILKVSALEIRSRIKHLPKSSYQSHDVNSGIFSIKFPGPVIFSIIFSPKGLACDNLKSYRKTHEYEAKHWASVVQIFFESVFTFRQPWYYILSLFGEKNPPYILF